MEKISKIPDDFLVETELTLEQVRVLIEQINRFNELSEAYQSICEPELDKDGNLMFSKGTIIHGMKYFDKNKLNSISKTGILTGQAVGISEDCETYYCADFHRVKENITVDEYNLNFKINDGRSPFGKRRADISDNVAFVIVPNDKNRELLSYDCYREGTREAEVTRSFVRNMPLDMEVGASILYGVPANCINGIIVGGKLLDDKSNIDFLIDKFPNSYIISAYGELIYNPARKEVKDDEIVNLRREKALLLRDRRMALDTISKCESDIASMKVQYDSLWYQMLFNCSSQDIANVLIGLGWQGNINAEYVDGIRKGYGR